MNEITKILIAAFAVYGFYSVLWEIRHWLFRISARQNARQKIDKAAKKEYNNTVSKP